MADPTDTSQGLDWLLGLLGIDMVSGQSRNGVGRDINSFLSEEKNQSLVEDLERAETEDEMKRLAIKVVDTLLVYPNIRVPLLHPSVSFDLIEKFLELVIKRVQHKSARSARNLKHIIDRFVHEAIQYLEDIRQERVASPVVEAATVAHTSS